MAGRAHGPGVGREWAGQARGRTDRALGTARALVESQARAAAGRSTPAGTGPQMGRRSERRRSRAGTVATELAERLVGTQPKEGAPRLVHGSLYAHHVLDHGDGPGLIDWQKF